MDFVRKQNDSFGGLVPFLSSVNKVRTGKNRVAACISVTICVSVLVNIAKLLSFFSFMNKAL